MNKLLPLFGVLTATALFTVSPVNMPQPRALSNIHCLFLF